MRKGFDFVGVSTVYLCHDGKGNYVLQKRSERCRDEHGRWDCGGGGLEFGVSVEENLKNEIREELGAKVLEMDFLGFRDVHRVHNGEKTHWVALDYRVLVDPASVVNGEPEKFDEVKWFKLAEFPKNLHSQLPIVLENYRGRL